MDKYKECLAEALTRANDYWILRLFSKDYQRWVQEEYLLDKALDCWFARKGTTGPNIKIQSQQSTGEVLS